MHLFRFYWNWVDSWIRHVHVLFKVPRLIARCEKNCSNNVQRAIWWEWVWWYLAINFNTNNINNNIYIYLYLYRKILVKCPTKRLTEQLNNWTAEQLNNEKYQTEMSLQCREMSQNVEKTSKICQRRDDKVFVFEKKLLEKRRLTELSINVEKESQINDDK